MKGKIILFVISLLLLVSFVSGDCDSNCLSCSNETACDGSLSGDGCFWNGATCTSGTCDDGACYFCYNESVCGSSSIGCTWSGLQCFSDTCDSSCSSCDNEVVCDISAMSCDWNGFTCGLCDSTCSFCDNETNCDGSSSGCDWDGIGLTCDDSATCDNDCFYCYNESVCDGSSQDCDWSGLTCDVSAPPGGDTCDSACSSCLNESVCDGSIMGCSWNGLTCADSATCDTDCSSCLNETVCDSSMMSCDWSGLTCDVYELICDNDCFYCYNESVCDGSSQDCDWSGLTCDDSATCDSACSSCLNESVCDGSIMGCSWNGSTCDVSAPPAGVCDNTCIDCLTELECDGLPGECAWNVTCVVFDSTVYNVTGVSDIGVHILVDSTNTEMDNGSTTTASNVFYIQDTLKAPIVKFAANDTNIDLVGITVGSVPGISFIGNLNTSTGITNVTLYALYTTSEPTNDVFVCKDVSSIYVTSMSCDRLGGTLYTWDTATEDGVTKGGITFSLDSPNQRYVFENITGTSGGESGGPYTDSTLTCNIINWNDIDEGNDNTTTSNSTYTWYINDENLSSYTPIGGETTINLTGDNFDALDCIICQIDAIDVHGFTNLSLNATEVCIANKGADRPNNFSVKDGVSSWDNVTIDTHDKASDLMWNTDDEDGDSITTYVCVADSIDNRNDSVCLYSTETSSNVFTVSDITGLDYNGSSVTYYVRLTPNDGTINGTWLDADFDLINSDPNTPSGFDTLTTHNQTPTVSWSGTDPDDGSDDHWPADTLTHHIIIEDTINGTYYSTSDSADNDSYASDLIPWGTPATVYADRSLTVYIWTDDGFDGVSANYTPTFTLRDVLPTVTDVSLTDTGSYSSCTSSSCALTPLTGTTTTLAVKAIATDDDADCNETDVSTATLYLCINTTLCNSTIADWNYNVDVITRSSTTCTYEFSVNKTTGTPEFWQLPDDYKFHITITSQAGARTSDPNADGTWTYNTLSAIDYPDTVYFGDGNLDIGEWTNGTELATMTNYGNNILTLNWSVTDPTNGDDTWVLNGTDLLLDDDVAYAEDDTLGVGITAAALNSTDNEFKPGTGLEICTSDSCTASSLNETMDTYYHAYFPEGLSAGEYNTTITITLGDNS